MRGVRDYEETAWVFDDNVDAGAPGRVNSLTTYTVRFMEEACAGGGLLVDIRTG